MINIPTNSTNTKRANKTSKLRTSTTLQLPTGYTPSKYNITTTSAKKRRPCCTLTYSNDITLN